MDSIDSFGFLEPPYQGNPRNPKSRIQVGTEILLRLTEELLLLIAGDLARLPLNNYLRRLLESLGKNAIKY